MESLNDTRTPSDNTLKIWQQNVNKSKICQHDLISNARLVRENIDIIALQEPAINHLGGTITTKDWTVIYPTTHTAEPQRTRSITLIRSKIITDSWKQLDINTGDVTAIRITGNWGALTLLNIYNDCEHDQTLAELAKAHKLYERETRNGPPEQNHLIWLGDFNRHHPHWDAPADTRLFTQQAVDKAEKLINLVADAGLDLALPPQIPTHQHSVTKCWSRLDHVFLSDHSTDVLISCEVIANALRIKTDHLPIITKLNLSVTKTPDRIFANFRNVDWDKFRTALRTHLAQLEAPLPIENQQSLDSKCDKLTNALQTTITEQVPTTKIGPHARRWWTKELTQLRQQANKLGRCHASTGA